MKIVFITPSFYPSIGGVEKHVFEISKRLVEKGNEVTVLTETSSTFKASKKRIYQSISRSDSVGLKSEQPVKSSYLTTKTHNMIRIYYFTFGRHGWAKKFRIWLTLFRYKNLIEDADIVHCHDVFIWYLPFRFLFPRKKIFTTFHGYESYPIKKRAIIIRKISEILSNSLERNERASR